MKVIHYYHIYCGGNWQLILNQHMMAVCNYGLINVLDEIRVGIVGPPERRKAVKEVLYNSIVAEKVKVVVTRTNAWEQYKDGILMKTYSSIQSASIAVQISACSISDCCRGKQKTAAGYVWKYKSI